MNEQHGHVVNLFQFLCILECVEPRSLLDVVNEETQTYTKRQAVSPKLQSPKQRVVQRYS